MMVLTIALVAALAFAWVTYLFDRRVQRRPDSLSDHERTRRDRNHLKGFPWQYDVSSRRVGRTQRSNE